VVFACVRWQNNKRWIPRDIGRIRVDTDAGRVEFRPLHKSDEGIYTCVAINDVGAANTSANVRVLGTCYEKYTVAAFKRNYALRLAIAPEFFYCSYMCLFFVCSGLLK